MRAIEVAVNGQLRWRAGIANACILAPMLGASIAEDAPADLRVSGMCDLDHERAAHVHWCETLALAEGDVVAFRFTDSENVTPPEEIVPTDSPEYVQEQRAFAERMRDFAPDRTAAIRKRPGLTLECRLNGDKAAVATWVGGEEHILCSLSWVKQRPDRCNVFFRSFGDKYKPQESPPTEWLRASLALHDVLDVHIAA